MNVHTIELPARIRHEVLKLVAAIQVGETAQSVGMACQRAEGFVLGLETAVALRNGTIEALYVSFELAGALKRQNLDLEQHRL